MNTLELKASILELISNIEDKEILEEIYQIMTDFLAQELEPELSPEAQAELEAAIAESYDESNWIPHEEVMKKYERWLKP